MIKDNFFTEFINVFEPEFLKATQNIFDKSQDSGLDNKVLEIFFDPLTSYLKTGKRIRPFLISVGADSLNPKVINAGIAFELCHTFALIHDDIMDGASIRRNVSTIHESFNQNGLQGKSGAMLMGDFLLASANEYMAENVPELLPIFGKMQRFLSIGQFYEMFHWGKPVEDQVSKNIARFKSAQYTFMYPLQIGLILSGKQKELLDKYSDAAGLAFQLRDDWLDISNEMSSGKDKNLDQKNKVPNPAQLILNQHKGDLEKAKKSIKDILKNYLAAGTNALSDLNLSNRQFESLTSLLKFSTTID